MHIRRNEAGMGRFGVLLWLVLLGVVIHVAMKIVPMYMDLERMKDAMTTKARVAQVLKDEEILKDLETKAKELDLPLSAENFVVNRDVERRRMSIRTAWDVEVHFLGGAYVRNFHFEPKVDENIMSQ